MTLTVTKLHFFDRGFLDALFYAVLEGILIDQEKNLCRKLVVSYPCVHLTPLEGYLPYLPYRCRADTGLERGGVHL